MSVNSENWQDYPYLVEWVDSVNKWAQEYEIYEFVKADDQGYDLTGQLGKNLEESPRHDDPLLSFVWTVGDNPSEIYVTSEFGIGAGSTWRTLGWYLGRVPHNNKRAGFDFLKKVCSTCQGTGGFLDLETNEEVECLPCVDSAVQVDLVHKASDKPDLGYNQQSISVASPGDILIFSASPY
jgi:hypothetical protein